MHEQYNRRSVIGTAAALMTASLAGCSGDGDGDDSGDSDGGTPADRVASYLDDQGANTWGGDLDDHTGEDEVTIDVGAGSNGLAFSPAGIRIDAGTNVVFEWTGEGGDHNVQPSMESDFDDFGVEELHGESGHTLEETFDDTGAAMYHCEPHRAQGMHGGIVIE